MLSAAVNSYKLITAPTLRFRYQVVQPDGLPDIKLTFVANSLRQSLSESSVPIYMRELLALVNWASRDAVVKAQGWQVLGSPNEVRNIIRQYLSVVAQCKLTTRCDTLGLKVTYVNRTNGSRINTRVLLCALKRLYESLIFKGLYTHRNPLIHEDAETIRGEVRDNYRKLIKATEGRAPMPSKSGIDPPPPDLRLSENYFRCTDNTWVPRTIDDEEFPNLVYSAGKNYGWTLRELCVTRTLFESGARISEILSLTAADWGYSDFRNRFQATNKGSHGRRTKVLIVSSPTAKMYRRYFETPDDTRIVFRSMRALVNIKMKEPARLAEIPLYLTQRGSQMSAKLFRDYYWKPALRAAGIDADPHQGRHWFVTNALKNIERTSKSEAEVYLGKQQLIQYMAWSSGERTLGTYEHVQRHTAFFERMHSIHGAMRQRESTLNATNVPTTSGDLNVDHGTVDADLAFILGHDHDSDT